MRDPAAETVTAPTERYIVLTWDEGDEQPLFREHRAEPGDLDFACFVDWDTARIEVHRWRLSSGIGVTEDVTEALLCRVAEQAVDDADEEGVTSPLWAARICGYDPERTAWRERREAWEDAAYDMARDRQLERGAA